MPVILPPGRLKLSSNPELIGSKPGMKTIGTVDQLSHKTAAAATDTAG
jgi:hypothetical protein